MWVTIIALGPKDLEAGETPAGKLARLATRYMNRLLNAGIPADHIELEVTCSKPRAEFTAVFKVWENPAHYSDLPMEF